jgi:hypothetical protein
MAFLTSLFRGSEYLRSAKSLERAVSLTNGGFSLCSFMVAQSCVRRAETLTVIGTVAVIAWCSSGSFSLPPGFSFLNSNQAFLTARHS